MTSVLDLWELKNDQRNTLLNQFNLTDAKTSVGKYILLTEYYASQGYFSPEEREDLLNKKFRNELLNPNMNMEYEERVQYIKDYLETRKIRINCKFTEIKEGKLVDAVTIGPIEGVPFILNNRCYSRSTIESIVRGNKKDSFTRELISDEIISRFPIIEDDDEEDEDDRHLDLSYTNLTHDDILNYIFSPNLETLYLINNQIASLAGVNFPVGLEELDLDNNQLDRSDLININVETIVHI